MPDDKLGIRQRAVLIALMSAGRKMSNTELKKLWKLDLTGEDRRGLNERRLVDTRTDERPYVHELTEKGWKWCLDEMSEPMPDKAGSGGGGMYALLAGVSRYLTRADLTLADMFAQAGLPADLEVRIRAAYRELAGKPGDWVSLTDLRPRLGGAPRAKVDDVLRRMDGTPEVNVVPEANQKTLTAQDRAAAVRIGGEDNHLLSIDDS